MNSGSAAISAEALSDVPKNKKLREMSLTGFSGVEILALDRNHDGVITKQEISQFVSDAQMKEHAGQTQRNLLLGISALLLVVVVLLGGLTALVVEELKESHVNDQVLTDLDGNPVQCASRDIVVNEANGALMSRNGDNTIRTLQVPFIQHPLSSKVPDKYLKQLREFSATVEGTTLHVHVNSFRRVIDVTAECGSTVALETNLGEFILDATHLWYHGGVVEVVGIFSTRRKLSADGLAAFYEDVGDIEFECFTEWMGKEDEVEKPSMPDLPMAYTVVRQNPCIRMVYSDSESMDDQAPTDICTATVGANARRTKPGASENLNNNWLISIDHVLVTETEQVTVTYMPNHPLQRFVRVVDKTTAESTGNNTVMQFQLYRNDPARLYCEQTEVAASKSLDFSSLHYLGSFTDEGTAVRKWAAGVVTVPPNASDAFGDITEDMATEFGLAQHMYAEFWDTDDSNHFPYYFGMHSAPLDYESTYFKSVQAGLTDDELNAWRSKELGVSKDDETCRSGRNQIREKDFWFGVPSMINTFTELDEDIDFYLQQISNGADIQKVAFQDQSSYEGYWGLAVHSFTADTSKDRAGAAFLATLIEGCESKSNSTDYEVCMKELQPMMALGQEEINAIADALAAQLENSTNNAENSGRRRTNEWEPANWRQTRLDAVSASLSMPWVEYNGRLMVCVTVTCCETRAYTRVQGFGIDVNVKVGCEANFPESGYPIDTLGGQIIQPDYMTTMPMVDFNDHKHYPRYNFHQCNPDDDGKGILTSTNGLTTQIDLEFDGIDMSFSQKEDITTTAGPSFERRQKYTTACLLAEDYVSESFTKLIQHTWTKSEWVPTNKVLSRATTFKFDITGEAKMLKKTQFTQQLSGEGSLTVKTDLVADTTEAYGEGKIRFKAGRNLCVTAFGQFGVAEAYFDLVGHVVLKPGEITFDISAGVGGEASLQTCFAGCYCKDNRLEGSGGVIASVKVRGSVHAKISNMWCKKAPALSLYVKLTGELTLGPFSVSLETQFDIVKGHTIGSRWEC